MRLMFTENSGRSWGREGNSLINFFVKLCVLCVSVVDISKQTLTTETQRTLRRHRECQTNRHVISDDVNQKPFQS